MQDQDFLSDTTVPYSLVMIWSALTVQLPNVVAVERVSQLV